MPIMTTAKPRTMTDQIIAMGVAGRSITAANALIAAATTVSNPDLKRLFEDYLKSTLTGMEAIQTYIVDQEWKDPNASPDEQLKTALKNADALISLKA